jgi:hypothetical protein
MMALRGQGHARSEYAVRQMSFACTAANQYRLMKKLSRQIEDILATVAGNKWSATPRVSTSRCGVRPPPRGPVGRALTERPSGAKLNGTHLRDAKYNKATKISGGVRPTL